MPGKTILRTQLRDTARPREVQRLNDLDALRADARRREATIAPRRPSATKRREIGAASKPSTSGLPGLSCFGKDDMRLYEIASARDPFPPPKVENGETLPFPSGTTRCYTVSYEENQRHDTLLVDKDTSRGCPTRRCALGVDAHEVKVNDV